MWKTHFWFFRATGYKLLNQWWEWEVCLWQCRNPQTMMNDGPVIQMPTFLPVAFITLSVSLTWRRAREGGVGVWSSTGWLWSLKSLPFKEITISSLEAIQRLEEQNLFALSYNWLIFKWIEQSFSQPALPRLSLLFTCHTFFFPDWSQPQEELVLI